MQLLGGQAPPRKYDYLTVYDPQENVFTCRLFTPKKMYLLVGLLIFLSSCRLLHVHVFLGRLAVKKTLLEGQPPRKLYFPCNPNLAVHAWRCTAKKHFLGGFPIFLGGFWPPRKFRSVVVIVLATQTQVILRCNGKEGMSEARGLAGRLLSSFFFYF